MRPCDLVSTGPRTYGTTMISRANFGDRIEEKSNHMRNMKLSVELKKERKDVALRINIAKRQYLCIISLINPLGRYCSKYHSKFINRIFECFIILFSFRETALLEL